MFIDYSMNHKDFIEAKKLIYVEKFEIINVDIHIYGPANIDKSKKDNATIIFKKGDSEKIISSKEPDFIMLAWHIKSTIRECKKQLVEVKDTNKYYSNIELLIPKKDNNIKDNIKEAVIRLKRGKGQLSPKFNLYDSFFNLINRKFQEDNVKVLLKNYFEVIASEIITMENISQIHEGIKKNRICNKQRYEAFMKKSDDVMRKYLLCFSPLETVRVYISFSTIDVELLIKGLAHLEKTSTERWKKLSNNGKDGIEGTMAAKYMVDDYNDFFELLQKMLKDLAIFINKTTKNFEVIDNYYKIETVLKKNGYSDLVSPIIVKLRHAGTHWDIDYRKKGNVIIYDTRSKTRKQIYDISYEKLFDKTKKLRDLTWAIFFSYFMWREIIFFRCLESPELKFYLIENIRD